MQTLREKYALIRARNPEMTLERAAELAGYAGRAPAEADQLAYALMRTNVSRPVMDRAEQRMSDKLDRLEAKLSICKVDLEAIRLWQKVRDDSARSDFDLEHADSSA